MTRIDELQASWMKDPAYQAEYEALDGEFASPGRSSAHARTPV